SLSLTRDSTPPLATTATRCHHHHHTPPSSSSSSSFTSTEGALVCGNSTEGAFVSCVTAHGGVRVDIRYLGKHHKDAFGLREAPRGAFGVAVTP
ncbi:hypothetical protein Tco_1545462, partial [Tanacetum coccineum]